MKEPEEWIERYFENSLSETELADFHRKLAEEPEFAEAFQLEKDVMEGIETLGNQNLRSELEGIYKEEVERKEKPAPNLISRRLLIIAAAAALAAFILSWWVMREPSPQQLYAQYFQPEFSFTEKGGHENLVRQVESTLSGGYYKAALNMLELILDTYPDNADYLLAHGIALVETGNPGDGIEEMQKAAAYNTSYKNEVLWYQALAYLKQGELTKSVALLEQIDEGSARYQEADELSREVMKLIRD